MVKVENLHVQLGNVSVLRGVDMQVEDRETLAVIGESGCGKTVLMKAIMGLIPVEKGRIFIDEMDTTDFDERLYNEHIRPRMAIVFQRGALWDSMTVSENIDLVIRMREDSSEEDRRERVEESLRMVELREARNKLPKELSGGMIKRAAIARAIATRPHYLIYDEPTTGLDPVLAGMTNTLIRDLNEQLGVTAIVISHDVRHIADFSDRVIMLKDGVVAADVPASELWSAENPVLSRFVRGEQIEKRMAE
jgi:phospholipid/cholesterol/gamma-HCH transport system ATP-binding protein